MSDLWRPQNTLDLIRRYDFRFRKKFGQNFLIDSHVLDKIADAAQIDPDDCVLEIGPGIGTLTQVLAERARHVVAVEIDPELIPILSETLKEYSNVTVIQGDILKQDIAEIAETYNGGRPLNVTANLPYYITTPILMNLLESGAPVKSITVMVQKEVAERMQAGPGGKDYGALSLSVQFYAEPYLAANVPPNCFIPRPNVGSAVIRLTKRSEPPVRVRDWEFLFQLIRAAFNQRRKTLANAVSHAGVGQVTRERAAGALKRLGLSETARGEELSLSEFAALSDLLGGGEKTPDNSGGPSAPGSN